MNKSLPTYHLYNSFHPNSEIAILSLTQFMQEMNSILTDSHKHNCYQIIWFQNGDGVHYVDLECYPVTNNTIFIISPGQVHSFDKTRDYSGIIIQFNESILNEILSTESLFLKYGIFNTTETKPHHHISSTEAVKLGNIVSELNAEITLTEAFAHEDYLKTLILQLIIQVQRAAERQDSHRPHHNIAPTRIFTQFKMLVEKEYHIMHNVADYAKRLGISSKLLSQYVRLCANTTPLQIINDRIVLEAKRKIRHSQASIKEIAFSLGFKDPSYFVKLFKRITNHTPNDYRDNL